MSGTALRGVLMDLDGTLVDTSAAWRAAYAGAAGARGITLPDDWWDRVVGRSMVDSTVVLGIDPTARPDLAATAATELTQRGASELAAVPPTWRPGAEGLVAAIVAEDLPHAIVTSVGRDVAAAVMDALGLHPTTVVLGTDTPRGKPAPDPYLHAAALLGTAGQDCLAIEDSPTGVAAAEAAGVPVLVVPSSLPVATGPGRMVRDSLVGVGVADLRGIHARLRSTAVRMEG